MATNISDIIEFLDDLKLVFRPKGEDALVLTYNTKVYVNAAGESSFDAVIYCREKGAYLSIEAPGAFRVPANHADAYLRACLRVQGIRPYVRFIFDPSDGEVRPSLGLVLEDAPLTQNQLHRCLKSLLGAIEYFYPIQDRIARTGVVEFPNDRTASKALVIERLSSAVSADVLEKALRLAQQREALKAKEDKEDEQLEKKIKKTISGSSSSA
jgi:hypothetical protein